MKSSHCTLCLWFILNLMVLNVRGQAVGNYSLSVELLTYRNPNSRVAKGWCCEILCLSDCDNTFTFCLRPANSVDSISCPFGRFRSPVIFQDNINFQTDAEEIAVTNFTNITKVDLFLLVITVTDSNFGTRLVDEFRVQVDVGNGPFSQQMELVGDHAVAEVVLKLDVGCAENFYGLNCTLFCTESRSVCEGSATVTESSEENGTADETTTDASTNQTIIILGDASTNLAIIIGAAVGGIVGGAIILIAVAVGAVVLAVCARRRRSKPQDGDINLSQNPVYGLAPSASAATIKMKKNQVYGLAPSASAATIKMKKNQVYGLAPSASAAANIKMKKNEVYGLSQPTHTETTDPSGYDYVAAL